MHYELAKELKDNNFCILQKDYSDIKKIKGIYLKIDGSWHLLPTLSELIEACGGDFWNLQQGLEWSARSFAFGNEILVRGSTPEEAVAKLWLAINKK